MSCCRLGFLPRVREKNGGGVVPRRDIWPFLRTYFRCPRSGRRPTSTIAARRGLQQRNTGHVAPIIRSFMVLGVGLPGSIGIGGTSRCNPPGRRRRSPTPTPTERGVRSSCAALFGHCFTTPQESAAPGEAAATSVAVAGSSLCAGCRQTRRRPVGPHTSFNGFVSSGWSNLTPPAPAQFRRRASSFSIGRRG